MSESPALGSEFAEGTVLDGKYRIERVIGAGGMGVVLLAHHLTLDERVAIKLLLPHALANPEIVERFVREARASIKIKSEHVARAMDVGRLRSGAPYMVMEYLAGEDLSRRLVRTGALALPDAVDFLLQVCEALAEAHILGIIHRDLKPANLFVVERPDGREIVKILDFGISKTSGLGGLNVSMTQTASRMGTPFYMSPEQMKSSKDVGVGTDIWAMGVTLYELLTAKLPYLAESLPELFHLVMTAPAPDIRGIRSDLPIDIGQVVLRCLEKDRALRYRNVLEFANALCPFGGPRAQESRDHVARVVAKSRGLPQHNAIPEQVGAPLDGPGDTIVASIPGAEPVQRAIHAGELVARSSLAAWGRSQLSIPNHLVRWIVISLGFGAVMVTVLVYFLVRSRHSDPQPSALTAPSRSALASEAAVPSNATSGSTSASGSMVGEPLPSADSVMNPVASSAASAGTTSTQFSHEPPIKRRSLQPAAPSRAPFVPTDFGSRR